MKPKEILLFGASGQVGRNLIRKLTKKNYKVIAVTRNLHQKGYNLKTQGNPGYLEVVEANIFDYEKIDALFQNIDICINTIGILHEDKKNSFKKIHTIFPEILGKLCASYSVEQMIHLSALGVENIKDGKYAKSKFEGETLIKNKFNKTTIIKPSIIYSVDDKFTTYFMKILSLTPFFPIFFNGETKFAPVHVSDVTKLISYVIEKNITSKDIEVVGPEVFTFKEILKMIYHSINKKGILIPTPTFIAKLNARIFEVLLKNPPITLDQLNMLRYDNIATNMNVTNKELGVTLDLNFKDQIKKYSFMWTKSGQFAKEINK